MKRSRPRAAVALLLALWGWGCAVYQPIDPVPTSGDLPSDVRITRTDGSTVKLAVAQISGDTIRGFRANSTQRVHIPVTEVRAIEIQRIDKKESMLAIVGVIAIAVVMSAWIAQGDDNPPSP